MTNMPSPQELETPADGSPPKLVLFFGTVQSAEFIDEIRAVHGTALGLLKDSDNTVGAYIPPEVSTLASIPFSAGAAAVSDCISNITAAWDLTAIINIDEYTIRLWAEVCERLGFAATSARSAALTRSKTAMRRVFGKALPSTVNADCRRVETLDELESFSTSIGGRPLVLKPDGLYGSYYVFLCNDEVERAQALRVATAVVPAFYKSRSIPEHPALLAESYIGGSNHSVECLVRGGIVWTTPVIDVLTGYDIGQNDFHHFARFAPTRLSTEMSKAVRDLAERAVLALGLDHCAAHVEFVVGPSGPVLLEIGARVGGNRVPILRQAYGIRYMAALVDLLIGRDPDLLQRKCASAAVLTPYPAASGTLRGFHRLTEVSNLSTAIDVMTFRQPGAQLRTRSDGGGPALRIELGSDSPAAVLADIERIVELLPELFDMSVPESTATHGSA